MDTKLIKNASAVAGIIILTILLLLLLSTAINIFLMILAGALIAVFFRAIGDWIHEKLKLSKGMSLIMGVMLIIGLFTAAGFILAPRISSQYTQLKDTTPKGIEEIRESLSNTDAGKFILNRLPDQNGTGMDNGEIRNTLKRFFTTTFGVLGDIYVIIFFGLAFTATPKIYASGITHLFPKSRRERVWEILEYASFTLKRWLVGKLLSMLVVAILTAASLYFLNIPIALTLGIIAGLFSFVPNFGPLVALVPAAAVAITISPTKLIYVIIAYTVVQALESNLITPFIQKKNINLPFAMILFSQLLLGLYTGLLGIMFATPLMAVIIVWIQMAYVHDVLHDYETKLLGQ